LALDGSLNTDTERQAKSHHPLLTHDQSGHFLRACAFMQEIRMDIPCQIHPMKNNKHWVCVYKNQRIVIFTMNNSD
jgi:hypothetical protein